eukprot:768523-Hanusia_phi.AAC.13
MKAESMLNGSNRVTNRAGDMAERQDSTAILGKSADEHEHSSSSLNFSHRKSVADIRTRSCLSRISSRAQVVRARLTPGPDRTRSNRPSSLTSATSVLGSRARREKETSCPTSVSSWATPTPKPLASDVNATPSCSVPDPKRAPGDSQLEKKLRTPAPCTWLSVARKQTVWSGAKETKWEEPWEVKRSGEEAPLLCATVRLRKIDPNLQASWRRKGWEVLQLEFRWRVDGEVDSREGSNWKIVERDGSGKKLIVTVSPTSGSTAENEYFMGSTFDAYLSRGLADRRQDDNR